MKRISSGSAFEDRLGYSRAVVSNGLVFVSATAATGEGGRVLCKGDFYGQTKAIFEKLGPILAQAGSSLDRVVQTKLYVTNIAEWEAVGRAHAEAFPKERPAMSILHVNPFLDPDMLVEVELVAEVTG
ncbi:RidA family protein [Rhizobium sp. BR 362]|uniref:RidA family protein n=1 Tax=Rhizobium sp. BR 362 TaxID=3040670 RepID=UPI002F3E707F